MCNNANHYTIQAKNKRTRHEVISQLDLALAWIVQLFTEKIGFKVRYWQEFLSQKSNMLSKQYCMCEETEHIFKNEYMKILMYTVKKPLIYKKNCWSKL